MTITIATWLALLVACTDYQLKNVDLTPPGEDEEESITEGFEEEQDTQDEPDPEEDTVDEDDCIEEYNGFDINEYSTLQDAVSYSVAGWLQDAIVINFDDSSLTSEQSWRVSAVEILVLISDAHYPNFSDGQEIHIELFDSADPNSGSSWSMSKGVIRSDHNWSNYTLPTDAWYAGTYGEFAQKGTWLRFDTRTVVPPTGMTSSDFIVGVKWEPPGMVKVGYSNFNQECESNWTNLGSGWQLNSLNPAYFGCSWPMFRVEIEVTTPGDCE
jgi:hypothetical protein